MPSQSLPDGPDVPTSGLEGRMAGRMEPAALCITSIARKQFAILPPASIRIRASAVSSYLPMFIALDLT